MLHRFVTHLRGNLVAYLALFVALGGTGYAAVSLPRNSVGTTQLRRGAVTPAKLNGRDFGGSVRAWAFVSAAGHEYSGHGFKDVGHIRDAPNDYSLTATNHSYRGCAATASVVIDPHGGPNVGFASAEPFLPAGRPKYPYITVATFNPAGQGAPLPFVVEILC